VIKYDPQRDYYQILGVSDGATSEEIERAYRNRALAIHPDRGGNEEEMKLINEARRVLGNESSRREYDTKRRRALGQGLRPTFNPHGARANLEIPVSSDFVGLCMGAATCFGAGLPLLVLVETQWVFFLWPLRMLALGALAIGVFMSHAALKVKLGDRGGRARLAACELIFWSLASAAGYLLYLILYA
jgi:hypothetical protein